MYQVKELGHTIWKYLAQRTSKEIGGYEIDRYH